MSELADYYRAPLYERALLKYAEVAKSRKWQVRNKLRIYGWAKKAFDSDLSDYQKRKSFHCIYEELRRHWQVFRNARGGHWSADETYDALTKHCQLLSRKSGVTLLTLQSDSQQSRSVLSGLVLLRDLKRTQGYPCMPVAKFTHFFNPMLFPIYDYEVIWKTVLYGEFRGDFRAWCAARGSNPNADMDSVRLIFNYTLMAADMVRRAGDGFMDFFGRWFGQQVAGENDSHEVLRDMNSYYATAFEFVAIGAAELCKSGSKSSDVTGSAKRQ
jgi:hypothetical protein